MSRYWILDPKGHRETMQAEMMPLNGTTVDTVFGKAQMIVAPTPADGLWVCDLCSQIVLTEWAGEPFPVPVWGSSALCQQHYLEGIAEEGLWPSLICQCGPCFAQMGRWYGQLSRAYGNHRREVALLN